MTNGYWNAQRVWAAPSSPRTTIFSSSASNGRIPAASSPESRTHTSYRITVGQAIHDLGLMSKIMTADEMRNRIEFLPIS